MTSASRGAKRTYFHAAFIKNERVINITWKKLNSFLRRGPFEFTAMKLNIEGKTRGGLPLAEIFEDYDNAADEFSFEKGVSDKLFFLPLLTQRKLQRFSKAFEPAKVLTDGFITKPSKHVIKSNAPFLYIFLIWQFKMAIFLKHASL